MGATPERYRAYTVPAGLGVYAGGGPGILRILRKVLATAPLAATQKSGKNSIASNGLAVVL